MTRFRFQGTGETVGGTSAPVLIVIAAVLLLGSGGAAVVAAAVIDALIGAAVLLALAAVAVVAWLAHRARRPQAPQRAAPVTLVRHLGAPERPALEQPRELHLHFHGTDPAEVAEILRRHGES